MRINPRAPITPVHFGEADLKSIIDISGFNLNSILDIDPAFLADEHPTPPTTIMTTTMATTTAMSTIMITKASAGPIATITTIITTPTTMTKSARSCSARTSPSIQPGWKNSWAAWCRSMVPDLLRYKGILYMKGINRRMLFQGVHMMMGAEPGKAWTAAEKPSTKMVFIGRKLPQEIFTRGLEQCLVG